MSAHETVLRDRSGDHFSVPVMTLPPSPSADGGPVRVREVSGDVLEVLDGTGRTRIVTHREGTILRMETTLLGPRGLYERVDQRKEGRRFISAFVLPGQMPRAVTWLGDLLIKAERGLVNYVAASGERLYETADGKTVLERTSRSGAHVFAWYDGNGQIRSKQIHDGAGHRHFLAYDRTGLAKVRLDDGTEMSRNPYGIWETGAGDPLRKLELMEDGSIRWTVDRTMQEVHGDGTRACRIEREDFTEFVRFDVDGNVASSIRATSDASGAEKTVVRDTLGIVSIRIATPRRDGSYDLRTIERRRYGEKPTWCLTATNGDAQYLVATIDDREDGIVYSFPDSTGMYLEHADGRIERVA